MAVHINIDELELAVEIVSTISVENEAYVCRRTGEIIHHDDADDELESLPEDIDDRSKYVPVPTKYELRLGKPVVMEFAAEVVPDLYDEIRNIFSRRGAYGRFKALLERQDALEKWYSYENAARRKAISEWAVDNGFAIAA